MAAAQKAVALQSSSAFAHRNLATLLTSTDPFTAKDDVEFRMATDLNPRDSLAWMARGLKAEMEGHNREAGQYLLEAAQVDHTFRPAWSLANYYMRANQPKQFWPWARRCLEFVEPGVHEQGTYDPQPVFELCWRMSNDAAFIQKTAIPPKPFVLQRYLLFLGATGRLDAALAVVSQLRPSIGPDAAPYLYGLCNTLIANNRRDDAVSVWNVLLDRHLLPYQKKLDPRGGVSLTNGDFEGKPAGQGFDWFPFSVSGVYTNYSHATRSVQFAFTGDEPENTDLLSQVVPLLPSRKYQLHLRYRTEEIEGKPGFRWVLMDLHANRNAVMLPLLGASNQEVVETFSFETPAEMELGRLVLRYDRESGYTRPKGTLRLMEVSLELQP